MTSTKPATKRDDLPVWADKALSVNGVSSVTGLAASTIWDLSRKQEFPAPFKLSTNRTAWSFREVQDWLAERKQSAKVAA